MFFLLKKVSDPKTDHDSKTDYRFYANKWTDIKEKYVYVDFIELYRTCCDYVMINWVVKIMQWSRC